MYFSHDESEDTCIKHFRCLMHVYNMFNTYIYIYITSHNLYMHITLQKEQYRFFYQRYLLQL